MTRLNLLPEEQLPENIQTIRLALDQIKGQQFVGGDNLVTYFVEGDPIIETSIAPEAVMQWRIIFTGDSGVRSYAQLEVEFEIDNEDGLEYITWKPDPSYANNTAQSAWIIYFYNGLNTVDIEIHVGYRTIEQGEVTGEEI